MAGRLSPAVVVRAESKRRSGIFQPRIFLTAAAHYTAAGKRSSTVESGAGGGEGAPEGHAHSARQGDPDYRVLPMTIICLRRIGPVHRPARGASSKRSGRSPPSSDCDGPRKPAALHQTRHGSALTMGLCALQEKARPNSGMFTTTPLMRTDGGECGFVSALTRFCSVVDARNAGHDLQRLDIVRPGCSRHRRTKHEHRAGELVRHRPLDLQQPGTALLPAGVSSGHETVT